LSTHVLAEGWLYQRAEPRDRYSICKLESDQPRSTRSRTFARPEPVAKADRQV